MLRGGTIALSSVCGAWVKEISSEEFPFENINNSTSWGGVKIFKVDSAKNTHGKEIAFGAWMLISCRCMKWKCKILKISTQSWGRLILKLN